MRGYWRSAEYVKVRGERFKEARIRERWSLRKLAKRVGLHFNTIWGWERGGHLAFRENLERVANVLGCDIEDLVEDMVEG